MPVWRHASPKTLHIPRSLPTKTRIPYHLNAERGRWGRLALRNFAPIPNGSRNCAFFSYWLTPITGRLRNELKRRVTPNIESFAPHAMRPHRSEDRAEHPRPGPTAILNPPPTPDSGRGRVYHAPLFCGLEKRFLFSL